MLVMNNIVSSILLVISSASRLGCDRYAEAATRLPFQQMVRWVSVSLY